MEKLKKYNPDRKAFIAHELLDKYRFNLSIYGQKLLYGLAQNLDVTYDLFPNWEIDIRGLFKYLNLSEENNDRYRIVRDAFFELSKNPIEWKVSDRKWGSIPWHSIMSFDADKSHYVKFAFNPNAKHLLLELKQFCALQTKYYTKLSSPYSMWLYPHLKDNLKKGWHELTIDRLKEITYNENTDSYNLEKNRNANQDFLKRVIGIENNRKTKQWQFTTTKTKDKNGSEKLIETGALAEINALTDLEVIAKAVKNGRSYESVYFTIREKSQARKEKAIAKKKRENVIEIETETGFEMRVPMGQVYTYALKSKMSIEDYMKAAGYIEKNGYAVKVERKRVK